AERWSRCSALNRSSTACATASRRRRRTAPYSAMPNSAILLMMTLLFLALGYLGVPVAFSLMAGVIVGTMLTPISLQSIVGQAFNGVDSEALMAIPSHGVFPVKLIHF